MKYIAIPCLFALLLVSCQNQNASQSGDPSAQALSVDVIADSPRPLDENSEKSASGKDRLEWIGMAEPDETQAVRDVYAKFKNAVLGYHGADAVRLLSSSSLEYYKNLLTAARLRNHYPEQFAQKEKYLSPSVRTTVSLITSRLSAEFIDMATPEQLYETAFNQGWIGYKTISTSSIDVVKTYNKDGKRYLVADFYHAKTLKDDLVLNIGFELEDNELKIDLVPIFVGLDKAIRKQITNKNLEVESSLNETVEAAEASLEPANWLPFTYKADEFSAKFPRQPMFANDNGVHIYTSQHHKYGQFDVRVTEYSGAMTPYTEKALRDQALTGFLKGLGAEKPQCASHSVGSDHLLQCDFVVPEHLGRGKAVWIFTPAHQYLLFNLARLDAFNDDAAAAFMAGFSYGLK